MSLNVLRLGKNYAQLGIMLEGEQLKCI